MRAMKAKESPRKNSNGGGAAGDSLLKAGGEQRPERRKILGAAAFSNSDFHQAPPVSAMQRLTMAPSPNSASSSAASSSAENHYAHQHQDTIHPVYKTISLINGKINRMDLNQMKVHCKEHKLSCHGKREAVKRRLKEYFKTEKLIEAGLLDRKASLVLNTDFFVVIDFEATCEERNPPHYPHEIIEFPAVLVSTEEQAIVDVFHSYVRPVINPKLSEFCRALTGIEQSTVDSADPFPAVHERFLAWMSGKHGLGVRRTFTVVTGGPFDMGRFLFLQTRGCGIPYPLSYAAHWANLRKCFANFYKRGGETYTPILGGTAAKLPGLQQMLDMLGLTFEGSPHSGMDDARNIARILIKLLEDRAFVRVNERIVNVDGGDETDPDRAGDRGGGRLTNVAPMTRKEAEELLSRQKKQVEETAAAAANNSTTTAAAAAADSCKTADKTADDETTTAAASLTTAISKKGATSS